MSCTIGPSVTSAETATSGLIGKFGHRLSGAATLHRVCQSKPLRWRNVDCQICARDTLYHLMRDIVQHTLSPGCASVCGADHPRLCTGPRSPSSHAHSRWPRQTIMNRGRASGALQSGNQAERIFSGDGFEIIALEERCDAPRVVGGNTVRKIGPVYDLRYRHELHHGRERDGIGELGGGMVAAHKFKFE